MSAPPPLHVTATTARLDEAIAVSPPHLTLIFEAVRDKLAGLLFVGQGPQSFRLPPSSLSAVAIVGDDLDVSMGPDGFHLPSLRRLIRSCRGFVVVSAAPTLDVYAAAAAVAVGGRNAMIVETRLEHEFQWVALIQKLAPGRPLLLSTVKGGNA